jgi:hypothetical protein
MKTLLKELIENNPIILGIIFLLPTALGVCYIIGAVKNWDWLYEPDKHYQNNCTMG